MNELNEERWKWWFELVLVEVKGGEIYIGD